MSKNNFIEFEKLKNTKTISQSLKVNIFILQFSVTNNQNYHTIQVKKLICSIRREYYHPVNNASLKIKLLRAYSKKEKVKKNQVNLN